MILPITLAYFLPCSPSKMTPELLMILTGCPRDRSIYPSTERCDERRAKVCSSSAGIGTVVAVADTVGATLECGNKNVFAEVEAACIMTKSISSQEPGGNDKPFRASSATSDWNGNGCFDLLFNSNNFTAF